MPRLKPMPRMSQLGRVKGVDDTKALKGGMALDEKFEDTLPELMPLRSPFGDDDEDEDILTVVHRRLGGQSEDLGLAQQVANLLTGEIPHATIPEAVVYAHLVSAGRVFLYQHYVYGGRTARGGIVPDFLVDVGGEWDVWAVQGEYYHDNKEREDESDAIRMRGAIIRGMRVRNVIFLWENDIYFGRPEIWLLAYGGRGIRE